MLKERQSVCSRSLLRVSVLLEKGHVTFDCQVRDISSSGAKLEIDPRFIHTSSLDVAKRRLPLRYPMAKGKMRRRALQMNLGPRGMVPRAHHEDVGPTEEARKLKEKAAAALSLAEMQTAGNDRACLIILASIWFETADQRRGKDHQRRKTVHDLLDVIHGGDTRT